MQRPPGYHYVPPCGSQKILFVVTQNFLTTTVFAQCLHLPLAVALYETQRATLVVLITRKDAQFNQTTFKHNKKTPYWVLFVVGAGAGFEPTTSGL